MLFNMYILPIADIFECHQIRYYIYADDTQLNKESSGNVREKAGKKTKDGKRKNVQKKEDK